jgi:formylglycine-generating enzyme required for sulfatase activity
MESGNRVFAEPQIGDVIEGYEILKSLGAGGMGRVYQVRNTLSNRVDAMKILLPDLASDPDLTARFLSEIQVLGALSHPNIAALYTAFRVGDRFAMILEFVEGEPLNARLKSGRMTPEDAVACICPVLEAVGYAHSKGVVHRDIKPGNIILTTNGSIKLVDFGIAKTAASPTLTAAGAAVGSAFYMSPEQVLGTALDGRSDLYSVGVTLYEMVTGERPIRGETEYSIMEGHLKHVPEPASDLNPEVAGALSAIIAKALAKDPADRFQTAEAFLAAVRETRAAQPAPAGTPPKARGTPEVELLAAGARSRWRVAGVAGIGVVLLAAAGVWFSRGTKTPIDQPPPPPVPVSVPQTLSAPSGDMTLIPAGQALLGADRHPVKVGTFYIDLTEVSNGAYAAYCRATGAPLPKEGFGDPDLPVVNVSFTDAQAFARWAAKRLPRPEEWEEAARGAQGQALPWGDALDASRANVGGAGAPSGLQPVRSHPDGRSPYGVFNMIGNVWEWVDAPAFPSKAQMSSLAAESWARALKPPLSLSETYTQIRGGSYSFLSGARSEDLPQLVYDYAILPARVGRPEVGFRCVKDVVAP